MEPFGRLSALIVTRFDSGFAVRQSGLFGGSASIVIALLVGVKEGARLGKLALQDRLVPSLQPSQYAKYR